MTVSHGKIHQYLGMTLDFTVPGQVTVSMYGYVKEIIKAYAMVEPQAKGTKRSAAPTDLFVVDKDCKLLPEQKAIAFHNLVAKTLYATKRAHPDT